MKKSHLLIIVWLLLFSSFSKAQPFTLDPKIKPVELKLYNFNPAKEPKAKGRISITEVTQSEDTLYYFVRGASIYSPVYVAFQTKDASSAIDISLHKMNWNHANRTGTTDPKGHWEDKFKTENDFGIRVTAKSKPVEYAVIVWVGDEPKMELPSIVKKER